MVYDENNNRKEILDSDRNMCN